jgi:hypothetical protein
LSTKNEVSTWWRKLWSTGGPLYGHGGGRHSSSNHWSNNSKSNRTRTPQFCNQTKIKKANDDNKNNNGSF